MERDWKATAVAVVMDVQCRDDWAEAGGEGN
jgi:hypothetical protein